MPENTELSVFCIIHEGLNNISKHAIAQNASVTVQRAQKYNLLIHIIDDGKEMEPSLDLAHLSSQEHFRLIGISERAALLRGTMNAEFLQKEDLH